MKSPELLIPIEIETAKPELPAGSPQKREVPEIPRIVPDKFPITHPRHTPLKPVKRPLEPAPVRR